MANFTSSVASSGAPLSSYSRPWCIRSCGTSASVGVATSTPALTAASDIKPPNLRILFIGNLHEGEARGTRRASKPRILMPAAAWRQSQDSGALLLSDLGDGERGVQRAAE